MKRSRHFAGGVRLVLRRALRRAFQAGAALLPCLPLMPAQDGTTADPRAGLLDALRRPEPAARERAVAGLAELPLDCAAWSELLQRPLPRATPRPGSRAETWRLWDGERLIDVEVHVHVPESVQSDQPAPLLLVGHGTGGNGRQMVSMWRRIADAVGAVVIAPTEVGANVGYRFERTERRLHLEAMRRAQVKWCIDASRIVATGVSRGGHLAWDLALRFPDRFAAIAPMIGGPRLNPGGGQNNIRYVENVAHMPIRDLQGSGDDPHLLFNLRLMFDRLGELGAVDAELIEFEDLGHSFRMEAVDWPAWLATVRRDPCPERVVRLATREDEARAGWLTITGFDRRKVAENFRLTVPAGEWDRLDEAAQRRRMQQAADRRTARAEATVEEPGLIRVKSEHVRGIEVLVTPSMLDADGRIKIRFRNRVKRAKPVPDPRVLLGEFVERLDPGFLPVARVRI